MMFPQPRLSESPIQYSDPIGFPQSNPAVAPAVGPLAALGAGVRRRWLRERRRRKVGRAYDMALEIARVIPRGSEVLDIGCGNGFIAHHLSAMLGTAVVGIDVADSTEAGIDYRAYDGLEFPIADASVDAVVLAYVMHHAQDIDAMLREMKRVLRPGGVVVIYEDIPETLWDRFICWTHDRQWRKRTGPCTFRGELNWRTLFETVGFEVVREQQLSRLRNLMHPVCRRLFVLRLRSDDTFAKHRRVFDTMCPVFAVS